MAIAIGSFAMDDAALAGLRDIFTTNPALTATGAAACAARWAL